MQTTPYETSFFTARFAQVRKEHKEGRKGFLGFFRCVVGVSALKPSFLL